MTENRIDDAEKERSLNGEETVIRSLGNFVSGKQIVLLCALLFSMSIYLLFFNGYVPLDMVTSSTRSPEIKIPIILAWTRFFSWNLSEKLLEGYKGHCPFVCRFTDNRSLINEAAAVVFHWRDFDPLKLPPTRKGDQYYVFTLFESPAYTGRSLNVVASDFFNLTMTYRRDSDLYWPYGQLLPLSNLSKNAPDRMIDEEKWTMHQVFDAVSRKNSSVLQFVSNCRTHSRREDYVQKLEQYIKVDKFGACANRKTSMECKSSECEEAQIASHRFYLAFENSVCRDYITEKFWRMTKLIVPIVLRGEDYDWLPNGSFIAADRFKSPSHLADYLKILEGNTTEYLRYFIWTQHYYKRAILPATSCDLCELLHKPDRPLKIQKHLSAWWYGGGKCADGYAASLLKA